MNRLALIPTMPRRKLHLLAVLVVLVTPLSACSLSTSPATSASPVTAPTVQLPQSSLPPVIGLQPVVGPPGSTISVGIAGFPAGAAVNLFFNTDSAATIAASNLTIAQGGVLAFALQLPAQLGNATLTKSTPIKVHVETLDRSVQADAVFVMIPPTASLPVITATAGAGTQPISVATAQPVNTNTLFITSPAIGAMQGGGAVTVTGSGSAVNSRVFVQVLDNANHLIGSGTAIIQAGPNATGPWQATIAYPQPGIPTVGYIVAYTTNAQGTVDQQASINIAFAGSGAPVFLPSSTPTSAPAIAPILFPSPGP